MSFRRRLPVGMTSDHVIETYVKFQISRELWCLPPSSTELLGSKNPTMKSKSGREFLSRRPNRQPPLGWGPPIALKALEPLRRYCRGDPVGAANVAFEFHPNDDTA